MMREVFVPMSHRNGDAQVNSGHALVKIRGTLTKCPFFVMSLPYSDIFYLYICGCECAEGFPALTQRQNKPYKCLTTIVSNCPLPGAWRSFQVALSNLSSSKPEAYGGVHSKAFHHLELHQYRQCLVGLAQGPLRTMLLI